MLLWCGELADQLALGLLVVDDVEDGGQVSNEPLCRAHWSTSEATSSAASSWSVGATWL